MDPNFALAPANLVWLDWTFGKIRMVIKDLIEQYFTLKVVFERVVGELVPIGIPNDPVLTEPQSWTSRIFAGFQIKTVVAGH